MKGIEQHDYATIRIGDRLATGVVTEVSEDGTFRLNGLKCYLEDVVQVMRISSCGDTLNLSVIATALDEFTAKKVCKETADNAVKIVTEMIMAQK